MKEKKSNQGTHIIDLCVYCAGDPFDHYADLFV